MIWVALILLYIIGLILYPILMDRFDNNFHIDLDTWQAFLWPCCLLAIILASLAEALKRIANYVNR